MEYPENYQGHGLPIKKVTAIPILSASGDVLVRVIKKEAEKREKFWFTRPVSDLYKHRVAFIYETTDTETGKPVHFGLRFKSAK